MMPFAECYKLPSPDLGPFYRATRAAATAIFATTLVVVAAPVSAQMRLDTDCIHQEGRPQSCSHAVACIGGDTLFVGGATGWDTGTLSGALYNGEVCTGTWDNATGFARFDCGDGLEGTVRYTVFDGATGTAIGSGQMLDGRPIDAWTGANIAAFIEAETGRVTLQCGIAEVPLS